jgi:DNA polymerase III subunit gamma/tau
LSHQALARRYRPRSFSEVAAQEHVSETLKRAVSGGRVGHAYLFCGPRGVGKTTLARVLAMALNCADRRDGEPCGVCESCTRIWAGQTALDVVEIDAASNRGVDDARDLRERATYSPSGDDRFKVYIVDEAHMLTREAWNALLKILEEPPPRVVFVFATTEPQKIAQTAAPILSRCQRFDLRRIGVGEIVSRLVEVLGREGISAPEDALRAVARRAEGGMRDALSLLDQVLALTGGDIGVESVRRVLGIVGEERYIELLEILSERRHADIFNLVESLLDEGYDLVEFYHGWIDALRSALRSRLGGPIDLREDLVDRFRAVTERFDAADLARMLSLSTELESTGSIKRTGQPRLLLEMLLLRLSYLDHTVDVESLLKALGGAPFDGGGSGVGGGGSGRVASTAPATSGRATAQRSTAPSPPASSASDKMREAVGGASSQPAPPPTVAPPPAEVPQPPASSVAEAWERVLEGSGRVLPGMATFLRVATVREVSAGNIEIDLPPGPGHERLSDLKARTTLAGALSEALGRRVTLTLAEAKKVADAGARITPETVKQGRLKELTEKEPLLARAVEELDLELLE